MKIGRRRESTGDWQLNIRDIPKELGDALNALWQQQVEDCVKAHVKPIGWHAFLVEIWGGYVEEKING